MTAGVRGQAADASARLLAGRACRWCLRAAHQHLQYAGAGRACRSRRLLLGGAGGALRDALALISLPADPVRAEASAEDHRRTRGLVGRTSPLAFGALLHRAPPPRGPGDDCGCCCIADPGLGCSLSRPSEGRALPGAQRHADAIRPFGAETCSAAARRCVAAGMSRGCACRPCAQGFGQSAGQTAIAVMNEWLLCARGGAPPPGATAPRRARGRSANYAEARRRHGVERRADSHDRFSSTAACSGLPQLPDAAAPLHYAGLVGDGCR